MESLWPAIVGAGASATLMALANISNRRDRDIREIFRRINEIEKDVAQLKPQPRVDRNWRAK